MRALHPCQGSGIAEGTNPVPLLARRLQYPMMLIEAPDACQRYVVTRCPRREVGQVKRGCMGRGRDSEAEAATQEYRLLRKTAFDTLFALSRGVSIGHHTAMETRIRLEAEGEQET